MATRAAHQSPRLARYGSPTTPQAVQANPPRPTHSLQVPSAHRLIAEPLEKLAPGGRVVGASNGLWGLVHSPRMPVLQLNGGPWISYSCASRCRSWVWSLGPADIPLRADGNRRGRSPPSSLRCEAHRIATAPGSLRPRNGPESRSRLILPRVSNILHEAVEEHLRKGGRYGGIAYERRSLCSRGSRIFRISQWWTPGVAVSPGRAHRNM